MEKRFLIFIIISLCIMFGYMFLLEKLGMLPEVPQEIQEKILEKEDDAKNIQEEKIEGGITSGEIITGQEVTPLISGEPVAETEKETIIENEIYRAVLSNKGGIIKEWTLKEYKEDGNEDKVKLFKIPPPEIADNVIYPLSFISDVETDLFQRGIYSQDGEGGLLNFGKPDTKISFFLKDDAGRWVKKSLIFHNDSYIVDIDIETGGFENVKYKLSLGENFGISDWGSSNYISFVGPVVMNDNETERLKQKDIEGKLYKEGEIEWITLQDKYFISSLIPKENAGGYEVIKKGDNSLILSMVYDGSKPHRALKLFAGPKKLKLLEPLGLETNIDFGWFLFGSWSLVWLAARPLFSLLQTLYEFTHNYGISIILITLLVKIVLFPLTHKSFMSMRAMKDIQPKIAALQAKYKNDKDKMNRELIDLYKKHKVNPLGGCLPMLLQMPVFVALYNILFTSIDIRHAPFALWITDLSVKDPYYVLPIIMGVTMVLQQKMQPAPLDPVQSKMMMIMPILFTFMFLNFPSGLVLYWMTNNILTIVQQYFTQKFFDKKSLVEAS